MKIYNNIFAQTSVVVRGGPQNFRTIFNLSLFSDRKNSKHTVMAI